MTLMSELHGGKVFAHYNSIEAEEIDKDQSDFYYYEVRRVYSVSLVTVLRATTANPLTALTSSLMRSTTYGPLSSGRKENCRIII